MGIGIGILDHRFREQIYDYYVTFQEFPQFSEIPTPIYKPRIGPLTEQEYDYMTRFGADTKDPSLIIEEQEKRGTLSGQDEKVGNAIMGAHEGGLHSKFMFTLRSHLHYKYKGEDYDKIQRSDLHKIYQLSKYEAVR